MKTNNNHNSRNPYAPRAYPVQRSWPTQADSRRAGEDLDTAHHHRLHDRLHRDEDDEPEGE